MTKITILGAGITGMAVASQLPRHYDITIIARNLPGDEPHSKEWASPWAGAIWGGMDGSTPREQQMQLESYAVLWKLAYTNPESSVRRMVMEEYRDYMTVDQIWYRNNVNGFEVLPTDTLPPDASLGFRYETIVLSPMTFLPWFRSKLEATGVKFKRCTVSSLADVRGMGHDVLINASGIGPLRLTDVRDINVQEVRGQTLLVKSDYNKLFVRHGKHYTYVFPRQDGTAVLGGIKEFNNTNTEVDEDRRADIVRRVHENLPKEFPSADPKDYPIVHDIVGIRPQRNGNVRVEKEIISGQNVVHAYGASGGGYVYSFGVAKEVARMVDEYLMDSSVAAKL